MTETDIKTLLERFYEGNTSLEEERILSEFLLRNDSISPGLEPDKNLFRSINRLEKIVSPQEFENKIEYYIDCLDNKSKKRAGIWSTVWKKTAGIAAAVVVLIAAGISYNHYETRQKNSLYISQEKVYSETVRALVLLSQNLNKGTSKVDVAENKVDKLSEILNKQFQ